MRNLVLFIVLVFALLCSGCNAIEGLAGGIHRDLQNYNQGNADARRSPAFVADPYNERDHFVREK